MIMNLVCVMGVKRIFNAMQMNVHITCLFLFKNKQIAKKKVRNHVNKELNNISSQVLHMFFSLM